ncbi:hypothetical protein LCGC14_3075070 [marine sediment metagenome]|uniref:Uncharacterized protein n=1 Tax=marine sediment metagenome TaxID=412755 RepID=A0A0F8Z5Q0_9ZZZZ
MNKLWIEHSHNSAECCRDEFFDDGVVDLRRFEYLDTMGLFETSWMIYEDHEDQRSEYGYPNNE